MSRTRYPLDPSQAMPGKPVRTRQRSSSDDRPAVPYLGRTLLPLPEDVARQGSYVVRAGDRIDNVSARLLGDPQLYGLLMEANGASNPALLCITPGRTLAVPAVAGHSTSAFGQPPAAGRSAAAAPTDHQQDDAASGEEAS